MQATRSHNPELIRDALFARCKFYWGAALLTKLVVFVFGVLVVFAQVDAKVIALIGLLLAALSEFLFWKSDRWKSAANGLHRKVDFENSFGWNVSDSELMDYLARYPGDLQKLVGEPTGSFFASKQSPGAKRAIENLRESSWWSMHLAESMWWISIFVIVAVVFGCVFLLNASLGDISTMDTQLKLRQGVGEGVIKVVTSAILFIFTYGLFRFATGYYSFCIRSKQIKERSEQILQSSSVDELQAIKLWQDYHLARESAPLIPTWIWSLRQRKLNLLWQCYVKTG